MKHFLPLLFAILLLVVQTGCKPSTNTNNTSNDNTNMAVEQQSPEESPGGGGTPYPSGTTINPDPTCDGSRDLFVGVHANVIITAADGTSSGVIDAGETGWITVACSASVTIYR